MGNRIKLLLAGKGSIYTNNGHIAPETLIFLLAHELSPWTITARTEAHCIPEMFWLRVRSYSE